MSLQPRPNARAMTLALLALGLVSGTALSQATSKEAQLVVPADGQTYDSFGHAVSISGNVAFIGAFADDDKGSATVYTWNGGSWIPGQTLKAADATPGDSFGISLAVDGDLAVIAAPQDDDLGAGSGSVYVYRNLGGTWVAQPKLHAGDGESADKFGSSVAFAGDVLAVGAPNEDGLGADAGAVYAYRWNGQAFVGEQKLAIGGAGDQLGWTVATDGDVIVATALGDSQNGSESGAVHVFRWNGANWVHEQKLTASNGAAGDWYGWGLDVEGDRIVVGAIHHDAPATNSGSAYVYRWIGASWVEEQQLVPSDNKNYDAFGWCVSISGDRVLVGSPGASNGSGAGAAYVFQDSGPTWVESHKWVPSNPNAGGQFLDSMGLGLALDGNTALVGSPFATNPVSGKVDAGAAYRYKLTSLALDTIPDAVAPGQNLEFRTYGGLPGAAMGLLITAVNGNPFVQFFYTSAFDGLGRNSLPIVMPAGASGLDVSFKAAGYWQLGKVGYSNQTTVSML